MGKRTGRPRGRPVGVKNKASAKREAEIKASGLTPLDYMLGILRDERLDNATRMDAAAKAAPYVHPRLNAVEHKGELNLHHDDAQSVTSKLLPELAGAGASAAVGSSH